jgi:hypothetical protein
MVHYLYTSYILNFTNIEPYYAFVKDFAKKVLKRMNSKLALNLPEGLCP